MIENKRDLSISLARANIIVLFTGTPVAILQFLIFSMIHGTEKSGTTWDLIFQSKTIQPTQAVT